MERRHKKMKVVASGEEPRCVVDDVPDDLLRLILLRLDSPLWLFRAACVCKRWRHIVDAGDRGRAFLRLASSLHPPAVVGHYQNNVGGGRRFVTSSSLPAPSCFSLDFIPRNFVTGTTPIDNWEVADCHGGLVLLRERTRNGFLPELVICDPLTRRWRRIHHPLARLIDSWQLAGVAAADYCLANIFLIDDEDGNISISNFRVLYRSANEYTGSQLHVFSFPDGGGDFGYWRCLRRSSSQLEDRYRDGFGRVAGRVDGSLYLGIQAGTVTLLDKEKLEFSKIDLPPIHRTDHSTFAVVHGAAATGFDPSSPSRPVVYIVNVHGETLELFRQVHGSGEWVVEHSIRGLSRATRGLPGYPGHKSCWWQKVEVIAGGTGLAILCCWVSDRDRCMTWFFSFNVDTMELQAVTNEAAYCVKTVTSTYALPWPRFLRAGRPLLKPKSISPIKANPALFQLPRRVLLE